MQQAVAARPRVFYGWWIVLGGVVGTVISTGFNFHALNAFVLPLSNAFAISLSTVAAAISFARLESAVIGPLEGYLVDRFGPRAMMFIGVPIMGTGFILASVAPNFPTFVGAFILGMVLGSSLGFGTPISTAVANWWRRKRGRAFGVMWLGTSIGAALVPVVNWVIETLGWRWAFRIMGLLVFVLGLPIAALMRHRPEQYGMLPDGDDPREQTNRTAPLDGPAGKPEPALAIASQLERDYTLWEALRTPAFWYFMLSVSLRLGITTAVGINTFILVAKLGGSSTQAGLLFLIQGIFGAPGRLFLSWAGDTINKRYIMAVCLAIMAVVLLLISRATSVAEITLLWVPYSVVWGGLSTLVNPLRADLFGRRNYATIQGATSPVTAVVNVGTPVLATWLFERTGSYRIPFALLGGMAVVSMVLILLAKPPKERAAAS